MAYTTDPLGTRIQSYKYIFGLLYVALTVIVVCCTDCGDCGLYSLWLLYVVHALPVIVVCCSTHCEFCKLHSLHFPSVVVVARLDLHHHCRSSHYRSASFPRPLYV